MDLSIGWVALHNFIMTLINEQLIDQMEHFSYKTQDNTDLKNADHFWVVNENMFINQLRYILKDIRRFVNISGEVVIIDFSSFPVGNGLT